MLAPRTHALLVGIDCYPELAAEAQLSSCVNDVERVRLVLCESFGFREDGIAVLRNQEATREAIFAGLVALRDRAAPGDVVLFYYSGHGSLVLDFESQHVDHCDRSLVPYDGRKTSDGFPIGDITDEELYGWLAETTARTRNVALIADTCYSGGLLREDPRDRIKALPPVVVPRDRRPCSPFSRVPSRLRDVDAPGGRGLGESFVLFSACDRRESAFVRHDLPEPLSTFTYHLCSVLRGLRPRATYRDLLARVHAEIRGEHGGQTPQLGGARDLEVFGGTFRRPDPFLPVLGREGDLAALAGGRMHGVAVGSLWAIHPAGTLRPVVQAPLATLRIDEAGPARSSGKLDLGSNPEGRIDGSCRAFEIERGPSGRRLRARIERNAGSGVIEDLDPELRRSPFLLMDSEGAEVEIAWVLNSSPGGAWEVREAEGQLLLRPIPAGDKFAPRIVRDRLERIARSNELLGLQPRAEEERDLAGKIRLRLGLRDPKGELQPLPVDPAKGLPVVREGTPLAFEIRHEMIYPLYFHVLDIGQTRKRRLLYPAPGGKTPCEPNHLLRVDSASPGKILRLGLPQDLPLGPTGGKEVFLVFATRSPEDLSVWETFDLEDRQVVDSEPTAFEGQNKDTAELGEGVEEAGTGLPSGMPDVLGPEVWTVLKVEFWLERSPQKEST